MADVTPASKEASPIDPVDDKDQVETDDNYAHGARLAAIVSSLLLGMFLVALDNVGNSRARGSNKVRRTLTLHAMPRRSSERQSRRSQMSSTT